jgi:hypothetical protein
MSSDPQQQYPTPDRRLADAVYAEIRRVLELRERGCTCTPGRLRGGPAVHAEDVLCRVHRRPTT